MPSEIDDLEVTESIGGDDLDGDSPAGMVSPTRSGGGAPKVKAPVITEVRRSRKPVDEEDAEAEIFLAMEFARRRSARPGLPTDPGDHYSDTMSLGQTFGAQLSEVPEEEGDLGAYEAHSDIEVPALDPDIAREIAESRDVFLGDSSPAWINEDSDLALDDATPLDWAQRVDPKVPVKRPDGEGEPE